jgi:prepilin signal peptidase PulO-like enzyme (type II secretory pathway)
MEFFTQFSQELQFIFIIFFGLVAGSFISLVSYRLVSKEPILIARSKCVHCNTKLKIKNLIPLFSWIFQQGKCSHCHKKISIRYPLIEFFTALGFGITFILLGGNLDKKFIIYLAILMVLITMIIIDLEHYFIPDILQLILAFLATILVVHNGGITAIYKGILPSILFVGFGLVVWMFFYFSAGIDGIGIDDFKFFLIAGFMLGIDNFLLFMFLSGMIGAIFGVFWQKIKNDETFPFAPAICISAYICMLIGRPLIH